MGGVGIKVLCRDFVHNYFAYNDQLECYNYKETKCTCTHTRTTHT